MLQLLSSSALEIKCLKLRLLRSSELCCGKGKRHLTSQ